ncbi:class A beta-lactamase [Segniliparus rugosus]|uniref:Beta-lactamase n=1 Tax=Segniliparus rugosus (strain ATCC BAA-974 / DSM 45345 / CCUG 50838 / CIP 108380 / JCM 13579 / CDC 945) TaxID=679197 RepID=E5XRK8_SEGRC|nr:class A beta-lactamase [Segniliparus rugosus]EFV13026.2 hypothetical protein HMPREF9336_02130 [Segniliparus rugosus ATCC BAA-974]
MSSHSPTRNAQLPRRAALCGLFALSVLSACGGPKDGRGGRTSSPESADLAAAAAFADAVTALERGHEAEVGVFVLDTGSGKTLEHRADQRFMMCSTFKALLAGAVLRKAQDEPGLLDRSIPVPAEAAAGAGYAPFGNSRLGKSATLAELCEASIQISDNIAANLLIDFLGGPPAVTSFFRSLDDTVTRLDRHEEAMSDGEAKDLLDTTTPRAIAKTLHKLALGEALAKPQRQQLVDWMLGSVTGTECIRAGLPSEWKVADKTGTGARGERHDIAIVWPTGGKAPLAVAILTRVQNKAERNDQLLADVASAARVALTR